MIVHKFGGSSLADAGCFRRVADIIRRRSESRQAIVLAAGEEKDVEIPCDFEPEKLLVDPDAMVLQLNRKDAVWEF